MASVPLPSLRPELAPRPTGTVSIAMAVLPSAAVMLGSLPRTEQQSLPFAPANRYFGCTAVSDVPPYTTLGLLVPNVVESRKVTHTQQFHHWYPFPEPGPAHCGPNTL